MNLFNYLLTVVLIIIVDLPWLLLGSKTSKSMILSIQGSELSVRWFPSLIVYFALAYLVTLPQSYSEAFLLGLSTYSVYDFTNYAIFKNYNLKFAVSDSIWGGILMTIVYSIKKKFSLN